jgi:hypothetical protein
MIIITVEDVKSSTVVTILQGETSYSFFQKSQLGVVIFENHNANSCINGEIVVAYSERVESKNKGVAKGGLNLSKYSKIESWFNKIANTTNKTHIENILKNWSDDLLRQLEAVPTKNAEFLTRVETNPSILNYFEEGSKVISNKATNLKAVELDMYALDKARISDFVFDNYGNYKSNPTRRSFHDAHDSQKLTINAESGKIREANGNILTTDNVNAEGLMYVIDESNNIFIGGRAGANMPHPTLIGGTNPNVKSAGMIRFEDGRILEISNSSGHFKPSGAALQEAESIFRQKIPANSFDSRFKIVNFE